MLASAFLLGLGGSLHCVGMCGPLALALPGSGRNYWEDAANGLVYNLGRITTYGILGFVFGLASEWVLPVDWQGGFSVAVGVLLLISALAVVDPEKSLLRIPIVKRFYHNITKYLSKAMGNRQFFLMGLLNGLMPCGMVYFALTTSLVAGSWFHSTAYMLLFGLGTAPLMLFSTFLGMRYRSFVSRKLRVLMPATLGVVGVFMIFRGLAFMGAYHGPFRDLLCH